MASREHLTSRSKYDIFRANYAKAEEGGDGSLAEAADWARRGVYYLKRAEEQPPKVSYHKFLPRSISSERRS